MAGKSKCDSLDDLKDLGGRATHFVMDISSPGKHQTLELTTSSTRIHIYEIGDQLPAWSKYVNVAAIFEKRKLRLKSAIRTAAWQIFAGLWLLTIALWIFAPHAVKPVPAYELPRLAGSITVAAAVAYYFVSSQSIVYLRYPKESRRRKMVRRTQTRNHRGRHLCAGGSDYQPHSGKDLEVGSSAFAPGSLHNRLSISLLILTTRTSSI